jgi:hypothetical protein
MAKDTREDFVAVREGVGFDHDRFAESGFGWKTAAIDFRGDVLDDDPPPRLGQRLGLGGDPERTPTSRPPRGGRLSHPEHRAM